MPAMASAQTLDLIVRRCNNLHALVADTVGRASRNNLLVIAAVAPVLFPGAVLPLDYPHANPPPSQSGLAALPEFISQRLSGKRSASGRRLQAGERWASREPVRAVHKLVLWAGGLSTAGACPHTAAEPTVPSFGGSISMSTGGSISVSAKGSRWSGWQALGMRLPSRW